METHIGKLIINRMKKYEQKIMMRVKEENLWKDFTGKQCLDFIKKVAYGLLLENVKHQEKVGIFSQNMPQWTFADVGSIAVGAVPVPIYATNIASQTKYIIEDADIRILFVGQQQQYDEVIKIIDETSLDKIIVFDKNVVLSHPKTVHFDEWISQNHDTVKSWYEDRQKILKEDDLAMLIYTSGTTGEPKGVMYNHTNIVKTLENHDIKFHLTEEDSSLAFLPFSHVFERIWTYYVFHKGMMNIYNADPKEIAQIVKEAKPTVMCSVPRLYEKIYHMIYTNLQKTSFVKKTIFKWSVRVGQRAEKYFSKKKEIPFFTNFQYKIADKLVFSKIREQLGGRLKFMPCGGAFLSKEITSFFRIAGLPIIIGYGLTETTATVTAYDLDTYELGTVGYPLPNTQVKIGDNDEILVKGFGVMQGYYNKPEETAKVFDKDGWFKTGDSGKIDENGNLIITDRIKDLIKTSGGKYIAPQHLELILTDHNFIEQAVIVGEGKPYPSALLVPNFEMLKAWAEHKQIKFDNVKDLIKQERVVKKYNNIINELQECLAQFEKIKRFTLMPREFSMEEEELTPTFKPKRKVICRKNQATIEQMYA